MQPTGALLGVAVRKGDNIDPAYQRRTKTFTIRNPGRSTLSLTGTPRVQIAGSNAQDFRVVTQPAATVAAKGTTTFTVEFAPSWRGGRFARLSIPSDGRAIDPFGVRRYADPFVINLSGFGLDPRNLTVAAVHKDGGLEVGWSESQEVRNARGRRLGRYRGFHRRSGSGSAWTRSEEVREHSYRITAGIDASVQYEVRVEAYDDDRQGIADGTTNSVAATTSENRKPIYPGLPSDIYVKWNKTLRYVVPTPVDPDGDTITLERILDEDGQPIGPSFYNPTTRLLTYNRGLANFAAYKADADSSVKGGTYTLEVNDGSGADLTHFRVWFIVPLEFYGTPALRDLRLEPGTSAWTSLPGAYRGEALPESRITRSLVRSDSRAVPNCDDSWAASDWICFNPANGGLRMTANGLARTTKFRYTLTDNDPIEDKSPSTIEAEFTVHVGGDDGSNQDDTRVTLEGHFLSPPVFGDTLNVDGPAQSATVGEAFSYIAPEATDPNEEDTITYTAALSDGGALPGWLAFNAATRTFSGTPTASDAPATLTVVMTATDDGFMPLSGTWTFVLSVSETGLASEGVTGNSGEEPAQDEEDGPSGQAEATPPTAEAGANMTGKRGGDVTLSGTGTKHAQGSQDALTYSWRIKSASHAELLAGTKWLKNATSATATYSVPRRKNMTDRRAIDNGRTVEFELTVTDGDGETDTDTVTMTIQGSTWKVVSLSVKDATAEESSGKIGFAVSLSAASRDPVTVDYATSNGTALAGSDYTSASGTLTFQPGETGKTVTVTLLDDVHDEGKETFTLTLSNPSPAKTTRIADATATGSITNADPLQRDWLARFGRTAASDAIAAVTARMETPRNAGSHLTLGGHRVPLGGSGTAGAGEGRPPLLPDGYGGPLSWSRDPHADASGTMGTRELLRGTSFRAVLGEGTGPQFTSWGQGASVSGFSGTVPGLSLRGESATGAVGMDYESGDLLTGFAMVHSLGEGTAEGSGRRYAMGSTVATALPYLRWRLSERVSMWSLAGSGTGQLTLDLDDGAAERYRADLTMKLAAAGMKSELLTPAGTGGFALALKADAFWVRTESDSVSAPGVGNLAATRADASRVRAVLDGSRTFALAGGALLTPSLELGVRHDGGDAETGTGVELGAGLGYADPSRGLDMALRVHGLAVRAEDGHGEWGVSGSVRLSPGVAGRGFSMSLTPSYGADPGGSGRLWMQPGPAGLAANDDAPMSSRFDAEVGYGIGVFGGGFTGTPNVGFGLSDTAREVRMGWRLNAAGGVGRNFEVNLDVTRREEGDGAEHGIGARLTTRW